MAEDSNGLPQELRNIPERSYLSKSQKCWCLELSKVFFLGPAHISTELRSTPWFQSPPRPCKTCPGMVAPSQTIAGPVHLTRAAKCSADLLSMDMLVPCQRVASIGITRRKPQHWAIFMKRMISLGAAKAPALSMRLNPLTVSVVTQD